MVDSFIMFVWYKTVYKTEVSGYGHNKIHMSVSGTQRESVIFFMKTFHY
jgi:hypothetical protein